jgi:O-antigen ligase
MFGIPIPDYVPLPLLIIILAMLVPVVIVLLTRTNLFFYAFMITIPLDALTVGDSITLLKVMGIIAMVGFFFSAIVQRRKIKLDRTFWILVVYLIWCILSYTWSLRPQESLARIGTIVQLIGLYVLLINYIESESFLNRTFLALGIGTFILAATGFSDLIANRTNPYYRLEGAASNPNWYFVVAICMLPVIYWLIIKFRGFFVRLLAFLVLGALIVTSARTLSRGGLVSLGVFMLFYLFYTDRKARWAFMIALVVLAGYFLVPTRYIQRFSRIGSENNDRFTYIWPAAWKAFAAKPWLGYGIGTSAFIVPQYLVGEEVLSPHNAFLAIGIDTGIPGIILYLSAVASPTISLLQTLSRRRRQRLQLQWSDLERLAGMIIGVLLAYMASWLKGGGIEYLKLLWVLVGLEASMVNILKIELSEQRVDHVKIESREIKKQILPA